MHQAEGEGLLLQPEYLHLHRDMWASHQRAANKGSPASVAASASALAAAQAPDGLQDLVAQPSYVYGGQLFPHQLACLNWLRRQWVAGSHAVLADDSGMGKTAATIAFFQSLL